LIGFQVLQAQNMAINNNGNPPANSAILDVQSSNKGILIPQVSLASATDNLTIPSPAKSLLVFNTNPVPGGDLQGEGYYFNSGTSSAPVWVKLLVAPVTGILQTKSNLNEIIKLERFPICEISMSGNTDLTTVPGANTWVKISGASSVNPGSYQFSDGGTSNRVTYTGVSPKLFHITCNISVKSNTSGSNIKAVLFKNGLALSSALSQVTLTGGTNDIISLPLQGLTCLYPNDYLEIWITDTGNAADLTITDLSMMAIGLSMGMD
jgi:hypothetical protein